MATEEITTNDLGSFILEGETWDHYGLLTLADADEIAEGTILARDSVSAKYVLFVDGGSTNENGIPKAVLCHDVSASASGDFVVTVLTAGRVNKDRLIIDADGDSSNVDDVICDQLRDFSIKPETVKQVSYQELTDS